MADFPSLVPTLIELGLKRGAALEEVQARQVIYGGDQQLNLLELGLVTEAQLLAALSAIEGLPAAAAGPIGTDLQLTAQLRGVGIDGIAGILGDGTYVVTVAHRGTLTLEQVSEAIGGACQLVVTSTVRMQEAMAVFTGDELAPRLSMALDQLGPRLRLAPASRPPLSSRPGAFRQSETLSARLPAVEAVNVTEVIADSSYDALTPLASGLSSYANVEQSHKPVEIRPSSLTDHGSAAHTETAPPPIGYEDITAFSAVPSSREAQTGHVRNIYELAEAIEDLAAASNRDRIVEVLVHFASSLFEYCAAFAVVAHEARGVQARGRGASTLNIKHLTIPLDLPSALQSALTSEDGQIAKLRASGVEGGVTRDLKRPVGIEALLCPVNVQNRPVMLVWCDSGSTPIPDQARRLFQQLIVHAVTAFKRVMIEKKRATRAPLPFHMASRPPQAESASLGAENIDSLTEKASPLESPASVEPPVSVEPPTVQKTATSPSKQAKHDAVTVLATPEPRPRTERPAGQSASAPPQALPPASASHTGITDPARRRLLNEELDSPANTRRNSAAPPQQPQSVQAPNSDIENVEVGTLDVSIENNQIEALEVATPKKRTLTRPGAQSTSSQLDSEPPESFPAEAPRTIKGFPSVKRPRIDAPFPISAELSVPSLSTNRPALMSRRIVPLGKNVLSSIAPSEAPAADRAIEKAFGAMQTTGHGDTMLSRRPILPDLDVNSPREDLPSAPALARPTQKDEVKRSKSFTDLVAELLKGNDTVLPQLVEGGESAVGALIAEFPGPVREPESPSEKASECGPLLSALVSIGHQSLPFVTVRTADENPKVRRWATLLLGELPGKESAKAIANRLLDSSIEVRRAALSSARRVRRDQLTRRGLRAQIEQMCRDQKLDPEARCSAVEAIADIREHEAIPVLLQLLEDFNSNVARSARWALCVLTRQDFGDDLDAWRQFWQQHRDEDRVEWLISSLDHEQRDIRRAAGDELRALCGTDFGYDEDQVQAERRRVQADFRRWWNETGKANLH